MQSIDTVVFDIGRVLVRLEFGPLLDFFAAHGVDVSRLGDILERLDIAGYERGAFDGAELLERIATLGPTRMDLTSVRAHWNGIFVPEPKMLGLLDTLKASHRVYLLSNIGDLHWEHLDRVLGVGTLGHGALPSYSVGASKPDAAIYRRAEELFGLTPARTVFIDDLEDNVRAARDRGWHAIHHQSHADTLAALGALGVTA